MATLGVLEILTSKVDHIDLVFGVQSGIVNSCVHARLQVSVCSDYDLWHIHTHRQHLTSLYEKLSQMS